MKTQRFTEVCHLDTCISDYFSGYHYPVACLPTYKGMTKKDLANDLRGEINGNYEYFVNESANSFTESEMQLFEDFAKEIEGSEELISGLYFCDCPEDSDCECETANIYLSLCKPVNKYGMTFLNE